MWNEETEEEFYALYLIGSDNYDEEDMEWATEPSYEPEPEIRYIIPDGLNELDNLIKEDEEYSFLDWIFPLAYCSIVLDDLLQNKIDKKLFINRGELGVTVGFDSGDYQAIRPIK